MDAEDADRAALRRVAMDLLARREHSRVELAEKLRRHCGCRPDAARRALTGGSEALIQATLDRLAEDGLQSDERYAESLVRSRVSRGQGPLRIRADLRQRGVVGELAERLLADYEASWAEQIRNVVERRFGVEPAADRREWARRARFLASRGFPESLVSTVLGPLP